MKKNKNAKINNEFNIDDAAVNNQVIIFDNISKMMQL